MSWTSLLEAEIRRRIMAAGPMPVSEYMGLCLADPEHGYYTTRDPLGTRGDFITAPEISQMFGELIGLWVAATWRKMDSPKPINVVELGPGRGTLMKDALRASQVMPGFREAVSVHLIEISPALRAAQQKTLQGLPVTWHATLEEVPEGPAIYVANEFFDALPVNQAVKTADGWHERCIEIDTIGKFAFTVAREPMPRFEQLLPATVHESPVGSVFEWRDDKVAMQLGKRLAAHGGAALVIDYGHIESDAGDTLQAVGRHAYADPLTTPGEHDLTAHVDFEALARAVEAMGAIAYGPLEQGEFLRRLGLDTRAATLKAKGPPGTAPSVDAAVARLAGHGRTEMGRLFKAAAYAHKSLGAPPAFD